MLKKGRGRSLLRKGRRRGESEEKEEEVGFAEERERRVGFEGERVEGGGR